MPLEEKSLTLANGAVWLRHFPANLIGRDFIVGDVHGCLSELRLLLAAVNFDPLRDRLFSVGDLVDRGPLSRESLALLAEPWFFAARGNHEQMICDYWENPSGNPKLAQPWAAGFSAKEIHALSGMIQKLPHVIKVGDGPEAFYVLHAELWKQRALLTEKMIDECLFGDEGRAVEKVLWSRAISDAHEAGRLGMIHDPELPRIFCGHTIKQFPTAIGRCIYLDTGAFVPYIFEEDAAHEPHFGLSLMEARTLRHWLAPTGRGHRGTVVAQPASPFQSSALA